MPKAISEGIIRHLERTPPPLPMEEMQILLINHTYRYEALCKPQLAFQLEITK